MVEGKIRTRSYDDKDGNKRYVTEVYADNFQFLGRKADNQASGGVSANPAAQAQPMQNNNASGSGSEPNGGMMIF